MIQKPNFMRKFVLVSQTEEILDKSALKLENCMKQGRIYNIIVPSTSDDSKYLRG